MDIETTAHIGDFIGGVLGPILTVISFIYVVKSLKIQQEQLNDHKNLMINDKVETCLSKVDEFYNQYEEELKKYLTSSELNTICMNLFEFITNSSSKNLSDFFSKTDIQKLEIIYFISSQYLLNVYNYVERNRVLDEKSRWSIYLNCVSKLNQYLKILRKVPDLGKFLENEEYKYELFRFYNNFYDYLHFMENSNLRK